MKLESISLNTTREVCIELTRRAAAWPGAEVIRHVDGDHRLRGHRLQPGSGVCDGIPFGRWWVGERGSSTMLYCAVAVGLAERHTGPSQAPRPISTTSWHRGNRSHRHPYHCKIDTHHGSTLRNPGCPQLKRIILPPASLSTPFHTPQPLLPTRLSKQIRRLNLDRGIV
jgi:hypothetical protein